jgi:hypothetical protein
MHASLRREPSVNNLKNNAGIAQLVERNLAKVEVASSRLVSRSKYKKGKAQVVAFPFYLVPLGKRAAMAR